MARPRSTKKCVALYLLAVFFLLGGGMYWAHRAAYFALQEIDIELPPTPHLSRDEALALTGVPLGQNIFSLDLSTIEARVEAHPWVARAFVCRKLPNKLFVKVTLERPVAMVATEKGIYLVNEQGRLFAPATPKMLKDFPAIVGLSPEERAARSLSPRARPLLTLLVYLKQHDDMVPCYANLSQIKLLDDGFVLLTRDAIMVRFKGGTFKDLLREYRRLDKILAHLYETRQYARTRTIRLDYPEGEAAIIFKEG